MKHIKRIPRRAVLSLALAALILTAAAGHLYRRDRPEPIPAALDNIAYRPPCMVVVDAGHGGEDGGAVSPNGRRESEYNLEIALKTELFLRFLGMPTLMTRTEDVSLHDESSNTLRQKKISDLNNRAALVSGLPGAILLSIHQNNFTNPHYSGAQVFHNGQPKSQELAQTMQDALRESLDPGNRREPHRLDILILNETRGPAILVECGFLSHAAEEARLRDPVYQTKLSITLSTTLVNWVISTEDQTND